MAFTLGSKLTLANKLDSRLKPEGKSSKKEFRFGGSAYIPEPRPDENRTLKVAVAAAVVVHLVLLLITFPSLYAEPRNVSMGRPVYVVEQVRFKPPQPKKQQAKQIPEKKTKKIPIPDPTPDEPEPILVEAVDAPEIDVDELGEFFEIPEGPTGAGAVGPMWVEGNVMPPQKIFSPQPRYTEEARQARIQGVVILQAIIDVAGNVTSVKVLKGLPEGLGEAAVDTVRQWTFKPATLEGKPVPVYLNLTVSFSLQ